MKKPRKPSQKRVKRVSRARRRSRPSPFMSLDSRLEQLEIAVKALACFNSRVCGALQAMLSGRPVMLVHLSDVPAPFAEGDPKTSN